MTDKKRIPEITDIEPVADESGPIPIGHAPSQRPSDHSDPNIGRVLRNTYKLVEKIGEGGMGNVYKAIQSPLNREVAIKLLKPTENNPEGEHYFMREVQAINMLRHPNIIGIVDFGKDEDSLYLVMEYLPGVTLKHAIRREFPLDPLRICTICIQVLSALEQAHNTGIVHCDLKPANIMLEKIAGEDDFAKVLDFGIAKVKGPAMEVGPYTQAGNIVGTFDYMSPEQIMRRDLDGRADVWSMGVILYEMLTRKRIFHDKDAVSIIGRVMQMPIERPSEVIDPKYDWDIPEVLEDIALKAMERAIEKRYESAKAMRDALKKAQRAIESGWDQRTGRMRLDDSQPSSVGSGPGPGSGPSGSFNVPFGPHDTSRTTGFSSRSGGFGMGDSQRLATGIAAGTSVLDQTFSLEEMQRNLSGERRKVAVLAIQQRSKSAKGVDPEDRARAASREMALIRDIVGHYEGKIDSFLGGTFTILFGAERARVGDFMRAVECAFALQHRFRQLDSGADHLGFGLAYGEIFLADRKGGSSFGGALERAIEVARSTTNARIVVDDSLIELTRAKVQYDVQKRVGGEIASEALSIRAGAVEQPQEDLALARTYVPRPAYFEELMRRAADARAGNGGGIGVVGELGVGKTVLIDRLQRELTEAEWQAFFVRPEDVPERQSLGAVRALIRRIANTYKDPTTLVRKACESLGLTEGLDAVVSLYIAPTFSGGQLPWQDTEAFINFTSSLFHRMVRFAQKKGPVLLAIDDVDIEDAAQLRLLDGVLEGLRSQPVLLVVGQRLEQGSHAIPASFEVLQVGNFSDLETKQLISQSLGYTPPIDVVEHLYRKSSGNPMFLVELLRAVQKIGAAGTDRLSVQAIDAHVPLTLHELLAERVDALADNFRDVLAIASVLGESFRESFFFQIAPAHLGAQLVLPELIRFGLLEASYDAFNNVHIGFKPRVLRNLVYERLPKSTREQFHARVIEFLEEAPELGASSPLDWAMSLAFHYRSVDRWEGAAHYLGRAGDALLDMYDYPAAIAQYELAEKLLRENGFELSNPTRADVALKLLTALRESGQVDTAVALADTLTDLSRLPESLHGRVLLERGRLGVNTSDPDKAISALESARDFAMRTRDLKLEVQVLLTLAQVFEAQNQLTNAGSLLVDVSQKVERLQGLNLHDPEDRKLYWTAYNQLGTLMIRQRNYEGARGALNNALARARDIGDSRGLIRILSNIGALVLSTRDVATAKEYFGQALQFARATGDLLSQTKILMNLGVALMESNDHDSSQRYFRQARDTAQEIGWHEGLAEVMLHIQQLRRAMGR